MLKYGLILLLLVFSCLKSKGQTRYYLGENNEIVPDSSKAVFYILVEEDKTNGVWKVHQYTLDDSLAMIGSFKDSKLQIPHGKFTIYATMDSKHVKYNSTYRRIDTIQSPYRRYIQTIGSYYEGKKDGVWEYYSYNGLGYSRTFKDDKLNGIAKTYGSGKTVVAEGEYVNDYKEGRWLVLAANGDIITEDFYKKGDIRRTISHVKEKKFKNNYSGGKPDYDFKSYLGKTIREIDFGNIDGSLRITFTLNKEGKLVDPFFFHVKGVTEDMLLKIINAVIDAPPWKLFYVNNELSEESIPITISLPDRGISIGFSERFKQIYESTFRAMSLGH